MKKIITLVLIAVMLTAFIPPAYAADAPSFVKVNGEKVTFDVQPFIENGRTYVPVRFISEALGYEVEWDNITRTVSIDGGTIKLTIGSTTAMVNGETIPLDAPARLVSGRTVVPLRFVSENLDCTVDWFVANRSIIINRKNTDGTEVSAFTRCEQSELYVKDSTFPDVPGRGRLIPKDSKNYFIDYDSGLSGGNTRIITDKPTYEVRRAIRTLLQTFYPTGYEEVYGLLKKTVLGEVLGMAVSNGVPFVGTCSDYYFDGREVVMSRSTANGTVTLSISIRDVGYINPAPQTMSQLSDEEVKSNAEFFSIRHNSWWTEFEFDRW